MKKKFCLIFLLSAVSFSLFAQDPGWPRQLTNNGSVLVLYTPQVEDWQQYQTIDFRMAFQLTPYQGKEVVGVLYISATTYEDTYTHMVRIYNLNVKDVHFPSLDPTTAAAMGQLVRTFVDVTQTFNVSMERIVACTPKKQDPSAAITVNNNPPTIFVSNTPAIILQCEGEPALADATKGGIQYVFNANWPLFFDKKYSKYYLFDDKEWQTASGVNGPWTFTSKLPSSLVSLSKDANWKNLLKGAIPPPAGVSGTLPKVFYSTSPAEIILFTGAPVFSPVDGTHLTYAANTHNNVFYSNYTSLYYYLAAGRWFSAPGLNGPWTYATPDLPADFANIPITSPAARVLASVPGTDEAADAVMIAQIPTKVELDPKTVPPVTITYSGNPQFLVIEGTTLSYAENTTEKVIMINNNQYYACVSGIWYTADSPQGPWIIATSVPQVIYTIPPSSPVYNVTYVTQTVNSSGTVEASYTAGYMGAFVVGVGVGMIIASGTGYYYPPYMYHPPYGYPVCYAGAMTYGAYAYHPYSYYGATSYHASYNPYTGTYARSATAYGPYGSASAGQAYNPYTGTAARGASVSTPYGTRSAAQAYNPYTGASASTRQGSNAYGQAGTSYYQNGKGQSAQTAHATNNAGQSVAGARTSSGGAAVGVSGANGSGTVAKSANGDMYASKDGNVYKNTGSGWNQYNGNGNWSSTSKPSSTSASNRTAASASAPNSEMSSASQDRSRGNAGASQWGGGGSGGRSSGGWGGGGGGGWGGGGGGFGGGGGGFGGGGFGGGRGGGRR